MHRKSFGSRQPGVPFGMFKIVVLAIIGALIWNYEALSQQPKEEQAVEVQQCLKPGQDALDQGNLPEALRVFQACVQKYPNNAQTHYFLGTAYYFGREPEKSIAEFKEALRIQPDDILATAMLGRLYSFDRNKLSLAKELIERVLARKPDAEDSRFDLARVYAQQGAMEKAFQEFSLVFAGEQKFALYHTELAKILAAGGAKKEAKEQLERALVLTPNFEPAKELLRSLGEEAK